MKTLLWNLEIAFLVKSRLQMRLTPTSHLVLHSVHNSITEILGFNFSIFLGANWNTLETYHFEGNEAI